MKCWILLLLLASPLGWAKPTILIGHYDAFDRQAFNNSQRIAEALERRLNVPDSPISIRLCSMHTIFDKAYAQLEDCMRAMEKAPVMVISLGETGCDLKLELMVRNLDKTFGPDNAGNERNNTRIIPEAPAILGQRFPLPQMYCALSARERGELEISSNAGSFVCNNTAFQMNYFYPEIQFGFIHVPASKCRNLERKTEATIVALEKMLLVGADYLQRPSIHHNLPHPDNAARLPVYKKELDVLRTQFERQDKCLFDFFKRARGEDERRGLWPF
jgi:pyrrolidone-carboxylate peptidase